MKTVLTAIALALLMPVVASAQQAAELGRSAEQAELPPPPPPIAPPPTLPVETSPYFETGVLVWFGADLAGEVHFITFETGEKRQTPCEVRLAPGKHRLQVDDGEYEQNVKVRAEGDQVFLVGKRKIRRPRAFEALPNRPPEVPEQATPVPRVRFGVNLGLSPLGWVQSPGKSRDLEGIVEAALHLRLGAQLTENLAVYYQGSAILGLTTKVCASYTTFSFGGGSSRSGCTYGQPNYSTQIHASSAVFEVTLRHRLQIALGPSLFVGLFGGQPIASGPVGGGGVLRIGAAFPGNHSRRQGFSVGLQGHLAAFPGNGLFADVALVLGYELF
ncbi:MAG TPA: hypothetical protein VGK67_19635 [Myxococcales bacterium]